jgi:hypothetical protein
MARLLGGLSAGTAGASPVLSGPESYHLVTEQAVETNDCRANSPRGLA